MSQKTITPSFCAEFIGGQAFQHYRAAHDEIERQLLIHAHLCGGQKIELSLPVPREDAAGIGILLRQTFRDAGWDVEYADTRLVFRLPPFANGEVPV